MSSSTNAAHHIPAIRSSRKASNGGEKKLAASPGSTAIRSSWLLLLFVLSLAMHVVVGADAYNEERSLTGRPPISIVAFLLSAKFWSSTLQTWQAEYLAIAIFVVLSIFLRQQNSAESKPLESRDDATGEANK